MSYTATFLVGAHGFGVPFQKLQSFSEIFWALHIYYSQCKSTILGIFVLFVYLRSYNDKSKFSFLETVQSSSNASYLRTCHFCTKCQYRFLALIFLFTLEKIQWKNYVRFWKWNLTYTSVGLKFVLEKIKFKVLHYIQHNIIRQCPGLIKDQIIMFKSLVINYFILKYCHTF